MIQVYKEAFKTRATSLRARRVALFRCYHKLCINVFIIVQNVGEFVVT
jgi:hypothetical protein